MMEVSQQIANSLHHYFDIRDGSSAKVGNTLTKVTFAGNIFHRDLEAEIEKFERVCAELSSNDVKPTPLKKKRPKVPPKPKYTRFQTDTSEGIPQGGTEV